AEDGIRDRTVTGVQTCALPIYTRVLDVQPGEERLISYAIDLGTEVDPQVGDGSSKITSVKAVKGIVTTVTKVREVKKYRIANRRSEERRVGKECRSRWSTR